MSNTGYIIKLLLTWGISRYFWPRNYQNYCTEVILKKSPWGTETQKMCCLISFPVCACSIRLFVKHDILQLLNTPKQRDSKKNIVKEFTALFHSCEETQPFVSFFTGKERFDFLFIMLYYDVILYYVIYYFLMCSTYRLIFFISFSCIYLAGNVFHNW